MDKASNTNDVAETETHATGASHGALPLIVDAGNDETHDPWTGGGDQPPPRHVKTSVAALTKELTRVVRDGLPTTEKAAGDLLPNLRSVIARSVHPYDISSRISTLNQLLVRLLCDESALEHFGGTDDELDAAHVLFGIALGSRGTTLTQRREEAARILHYDVTHFRKVIEPRLVGYIAAALYDDLLQYKRRVRRAPESEEPTGDTPRGDKPSSMPSDDEAANTAATVYTHQEELISRIWQHVYGWRAELIAHGRLHVQPDYEAAAEDHRQAAMREETELRGVIAEYVDTYGDSFVKHGDAEFDLNYLQEAVGRLKAWKG